MATALELATDRIHVELDEKKIDDAGSRSASFGNISESLMPIPLIGILIDSADDNASYGNRCTSEWPDSIARRAHAFRSTKPCSGGRHRGVSSLTL